LLRIFPDKLHARGGQTETERKRDTYKEKHGDSEHRERGKVEGDRG